MKAENLTISIPNKGCDKNCPYCISKMTGSVEANYDLIRRNMNKVEKLANMAGVNNVLITGKGEPILNLCDVVTCIEHFKDWPVELQTNGKMLYREVCSSFDPSYIFRELFNAGLSVLAISVDSDEQLKTEIPVIAKVAKEVGLVTRVTLNVNNAVTLSFNEIVEVCKQSKVSQLTFRKLSIPSTVGKRSKIVKWIKENTSEKHYDGLYTQMRRSFKEDWPLIKKTADGVRIFDVQGVAVCFSRYCVQECAEESEIRSLIFKEDGHLYTSWASDASILF